MTPKEKAKEIFEMYYDLKWQSYNHKRTSIKSMTKLAAKKCASMAVDLVISGNFAEGYDHNFWTQVKAEIEQL